MNASKYDQNREKQQQQPTEGWPKPITTFKPYARKEEKNGWCAFFWIYSFTQSIRFLCIGTAWNANGPQHLTNAKSLVAFDVHRMVCCVILCIAADRKCRPLNSEHHSPLANWLPFPRVTGPLHGRKCLFLSIGQFVFERIFIRSDFIFNADSEFINHILFHFYNSIIKRGYFRMMRHYREIRWEKFLFFDSSKIGAIHFRRPSEELHRFRCFT